MASRPRLTKQDFEALARFRYELRHFLGFSEDAARQHGVTPQQYQVLLAIEGYPQRNWVAIGELAEQMRVAHHSAVGLVDRLAALGLVERAPAPEDRRIVRVTLTRKGRTLLEKLYQAHRAELASTGPRLATLIQQATRKIPAKSPR